MGLMPRAVQDSVCVDFVCQTGEAVGQSQQGLSRVAAGWPTTAAGCCCAGFNLLQQPLPAGHCCQACCVHIFLFQTEAIAVLARLQVPCRLAADACACSQNGETVQSCASLVSQMWMNRGLSPSLPPLEMYWKQPRRADSC